DHRDLDDVRRTSLNGGVHGVAFCRGPYHLVARIDVLEVAPSSKDGLYVAVLPGKFYLFPDIVAQFGIGLVIGVYELLGLVAAQVGLVAQAEGGYPVDDPKVYRLGVAPLFPGHLVQGHVKYLGGRGGDRKSTRLNSSHVKISYAV